MTLPSSGALSLGDVNVELSFSRTAQISLGGEGARGLYGIASGAIRLATDGYGKSSGPLGSLWTWGWNTPTGGGGSLGDGTIIHRSSPVQTVAGGSNWKDQSLGIASYGIKSDGTLWAWGTNSNGTLGDNTITHRSSPVQTFAGGTNWKQCSVSSTQQGVFIKTDGTLWCVGNNIQGQLGDGTRTGKSSHVQTLAGGTNWKQASAGSSASHGIKTDGTLWSWGLNNSGSLADGTSASKSSPVQIVSGGTTWNQMQGGDNASGTTAVIGAVKTDGTLWSWGGGNAGQLADNTNGVNRSSPVQTVAGGTTWKTYSSGGTRASGLKTDGTLWNWGSNSNGALGDNTIDPRSSPVQIFGGGTTWKQQEISYNAGHSIKTDGTLWSWGLNSFGQAGEGSITTIQRSSPIQTISGGTTWQQVSSRHQGIVGAIKS